jgi:hypothetical protein
MSFNRSSYDSCTYSRNLKENVGILSYVLSPYRFEHQNKCRHELGLVAGSAVSHVNGNIVDLESDLRGQTRFLTKCPTNAARPIVQGQPITNDKTRPIDTSARHLPSCQMISYRAVPLPPPMNTPKCPTGFSAKVANFFGW